jgi:hypothetical protein
LSQVDHARQEQVREVGTVTPMAENAVGARRPVRTTPERRAYLLLGGLLLVAVGVLVWLLLRGGGDERTALPAAGGGPAIVSEAQLRALAKAVRHPVYWAGSRSGAYELTRTSDGRIYIRYLPSTDKLGDRNPNYLTVGTYPTKTAYLGLSRAAHRTQAVSLKIDGGGLLVINTTTPKSVYFAYPKQPYQVEVYAPSPQQARALVLGAQIEPIS